MHNSHENKGLTVDEVVALTRARDARAKVERTKAQRQHAGTWINAGRIMLTLYAIASVIGGIVIASRPRITEDLLFDEVTHPFTAYGVGVAVFAIAIWTATMPVLAYLSWRVQESIGSDD